MDTEDDDGWARTGCIWFYMSGQPGTHQILGIERHVVPPWRHKLVVAVQDATVHVLIATRVKEGLEPTESEEQHSVSGNNSI